MKNLNRVIICQLLMCPQIQIPAIKSKKYYTKELLMDKFNTKSNGKVYILYLFINIYLLI